MTVSAMGSPSAQPSNMTKKATVPQDAVVEIPELAKEATGHAGLKKSSFADLFAFTRRYHIPMMVSAFFTAALVAGARTAYAVFTGTIFDIVTRFGGDQLRPDDFLSQMGRWTGYMRLLGLGMWLVSSVDMALWVATGELRARTAREKLFAAFLQKSMAWYDSRGNGMSSLMVGIQTQIRELQMATSQTLGYLIFEVFVFVACISVALFFSFKLTLVMLATGVPSAGVLWLISRFLDPAIEGQKRELAEASKHATAATTAIDLVKVYNGEDNEAFHFTAAVGRSAKYYGRQIVCNCGQMSYIKFWMIMLFVMGFYFAVMLASRGEITPGNALTTFYAVLIAFQSLEALGPQWLILAKGMAAGQLLKALAEGREENGEPVDKIGGLFRPSKCLGNIEMNNVSFAYPSNPTKLVLSPSSFHFPAEQLTFVVGRSGSGKSTLANLLLRFYEPRTGSITVDDQPIAGLDLDWLRQNLFLVQQSSVLFDGTFFNNVAFGARDPDGVSTGQVQNACDMALLQSAIAGMPSGLDTAIGPGGYSLSGGQRQRLALARARLRDSPVLILDEVTSGLDPVGRALIMDAIRMWRRGRTTIIITHEVGHIEPDEYVYVMEDGCVVQEGFRRGLVAEEDGLFASLLASADGASISGSSSSSSASSYGESEGEEADLADHRPSGILHMLGLDNRRAGGLFHRLSLPVEPPVGMGSDGIFINLHVGARRGSLARRGSEAAAMAVVTRTGREVQNSRTQNARRSAHETKTAAASLDSLELFFLGRLAKPKDKKPGASPGTRLPSLKAILKTVWPTLDTRGRAQLILGLVSCTVIAGSDVVFAFIFAQLLTAFWLPEGRQEAGTRWATYLTAVAAIDAAATFFAYFFMEHVAQRWVNTLRAEAVRRILAQPRAWFDKATHAPSRLVQCLDRDAEEMRKLVGMFVPIAVTVTCLISASLIWALVIRWDLTLVTLAGLPVAIGTARVNSRVSGRCESACDAAAVSTAALFADTFSNIRVVRALTLERYFTTRHTRSAAATYRVGARRAVLVGVFYGLYQSMSFFITALVFYFGARLLSQGVTTVTDVLRVINLVLFSLGTSVAMLANVPQMAAAKATAVRVLHLANLDYKASHEARGTERVATRSPLPIRMANLRFAYPGAARTQVLRNINLEIHPATCTAIVGASGCGKSTLAALILRLYAPLEPASCPGLTSHPPIPVLYESPRSLSATPDLSYDEPLTYAGIPAARLSTASLRGHMAYVPQQPFLFPASVRDNITYGLHDASPWHAPANVETAARRAGIHDFIASLPRGYDTPVGEGGIAVSGGQAQRLALARGLVRHPTVLVLDEPTSALDAAGAEQIRRVVRELCSDGDQGENGTAVVVVTHSKEMMRVADRVIMIEGGGVVESGEYEELAERGGRFAQLVGGGVWMGAKKTKGKERVYEETLRQLEGEGSTSRVSFREVRY